jgi:hypothetical protein
LRKTGLNKLTRGGKLETYDRTADGQRVKIRTQASALGPREDRYWGGRGRSDGSGHGHEVRIRGKSAYVREPLR